eukprot:scaffold24500_cov163-Isochrysis_galbana.AAC.1
MAGAARSDEANAVNRATVWWMDRLRCYDAMPHQRGTINADHCVWQTVFDEEYVVECQIAGVFSGCISTWKEGKAQGARRALSSSWRTRRMDLPLGREQRQGIGKVSGLATARSAREGDRQSASCARREFTHPMCSPAWLHLPAIPIPSVLCLLALQHRRCPPPWRRRSCIRRAVVAFA